VDWRAHRAPSTTQLFIWAPALYTCPHSCHAPLEIPALTLMPSSRSFPPLPARVPSTSGAATTPGKALTAASTRATSSEARSTPEQALAAILTGRSL
jgi:hypothetical protein